MKTLLSFFFILLGNLLFCQTPELIPRQEGHHSEVYHVCFSPDERLALSADLRAIVLWDLRSGKYIRTIDTPAGVQNLTFSADGSQAIAVLEDRTLTAWDLSTGERVWSVEITERELIAVETGAYGNDTLTATYGGAKIVASQVAPDKRYVAALFDNGEVKCWSLKNGQKIWQKKVVAAPTGTICFSADGALVYTYDDTRLFAWATGTGAKKSVDQLPIPPVAELSLLGGGKAYRFEQAVLQLYDFQEYKKTDIPGLGAFIQSNKLPAITNFEFTPNKERLVIGFGDPTVSWAITPGLPANREGAGTLLVWDVQNDQLLYQLEGIAEIINDLVIAAAGTRCLTASSDKTVRLWDLTTGKELLRLEREVAMEHNFSITPDFQTLALTRFDGFFKIFQLNDYFSGFCSHTNFDAIQLTNDGEKLLTANRDFALDLWQTEGIEKVKKRHSDAKEAPLPILDNGLVGLGRLDDRHKALWVATATAVSSDGKLALVGSSKEWRVMSEILAPPVFWSDNTAFFTVPVADTIYQVEQHSPDTPMEQWQYEMSIVNRIDTIGFVDQGKVNLWYFTRIGQQPYFNVSLWDLEKKQSVRVFPIASTNWHPVSSVSFSPAGNLAIAKVEGRLYAWDIASGKPRKNMAGVSYFDGIHWGERANLVATIGVDKQDVVIWNLDDHRIIRQVKSEEPLMAVGFHPNGRTMHTISANNNLTEWDIQTGKALRRTPQAPLGHTMTFAPDTNFILVTNEYGFSVWDRTLGKCSLDLGAKSTLSERSSGDLFFENHHPEQISLFRFLPDGYRVIAASYEGVIRCWNYKTGQEVFRIYFPGNQDWLVTTPAGLFDASPTAMEALYFRAGTEVIELEQLKERYYEPGLLQKLLAFSNEPLREVTVFKDLPLYPDMTAEIDEKQQLLNVKLVPRSGGNGKLSLFVNGKEVLEDANLERATEVAIDLAKFAIYYLPDTSNRLTLRVYNEVGWLKSPALELAYVPSVSARGGDGNTNTTTPLFTGEISLYAIVVGTADYAGSQMDLRFSDRDATSFSQALGQVAPNIFADRVHITLLNTDAADTLRQDMASKSTIEAAFADIAARAHAQDIVVVYFSGHGVSYGTAENTQFYYLTKDIATQNLSDPEIRNNYAISSSELTTWLNTIPALKQVMIIDACNSGRIVEDLANSSKDLSSTQIRALDRMKDRTGMFILTGSAADKLSYEATQYGQGLLTYSLLQGMSGLALQEDKRVDVMTLFQHARDEVPDLAEGIRGVQTPVLAFPVNGSSFDIGIVDANVRIPIAQVKPVFIRNVFLEEELFDDILGLADVLENHFREITAKGAQAEIIFVDLKAYANAYSIKGLYRVAGEKVILRGRLFKDGQPVGEPFELKGQKDNLPALVEAIVDKVSDRL
ncbi:MAG: hypothetical protein DA408_08355 [Bacteroidetes bacterium]|nr:MAG: hypothetical protein DA408_08355 [Bacteroidota bacterium]